MTPREIADACRARGCCPLGAAMGGRPARPTMFAVTAQALGITRAEVISVANSWDAGAVETSVLKAQAYGLGPRIEAFLRGGGRG